MVVRRFPKRRSTHTFAVLSLANRQLRRGQNVSRRNQREHEEKRDNQKKMPGKQNEKMKPKRRKQQGKKEVLIRIP